MTSQYLPPKVLQLLGAIIVIGAAIFWAVTGQQSALIIGSGLSLISLGAVQGLRITVQEEKPDEKQ